MNGWRPHLIALGLLVALILLLFARDATGIVSIWWNSSTFNHCLLLPPIIAWLVWQRREALGRLVPLAWAPGLAIVAAGAFGWLLGQAAGVALARHLGLVLMLEGSVVALLGRAVARGLLFPLAYGLFLVPFGEALVPPLQTLTARISMALLGLAGVPARIDGVFVTIPNGWFEVAEACSGISFVVAMLALATLVAHLCFSRWPRRLAFVAVAVALSVLANGVRAFATIYVAHLTSAQAAAGFDHIVYGWLFFALVIALLLAIGWRFFDRPSDAPWFDPAKLQPVPPRPERRLLAVTAGAAMLAITPIGWSSAVIARGAVALPTPIELPDVPGWQRVALSAVPWSPRFDGADHRLLGRYGDANGHRVDLAIALYAHQEEGRELVGYGQGAIDPDGGWAWTDDRPSPPDGTAFRMSAPGKVVREVVTFYRVGAVTTGSPTAVKLETLRVRLLGGRQRAVTLIVSAEEQNGWSARPAIDAFIARLGPVDQFADRIADAAR